jgi:hypothetical protein
LKSYLTYIYPNKICLNKSFCLTMVFYFAIICVHECSLDGPLQTLGFLFRYRVWS